LKSSNAAQNDTGNGAVPSVVGVFSPAVVEPRSFACALSVSALYYAQREGHSCQTNQMTRSAPAFIA
jgi:hypothetical protein